MHNTYSTNQHWVTGRKKHSRCPSFSSVSALLVSSSPRTASRGHMYPAHLACGSIIFELESSLPFDVHSWWMDLNSSPRVWKTQSLRKPGCSASTCCFLWRLESRPSAGVSSAATTKRNTDGGRWLSWLCPWSHQWMSVVHHRGPVIQISLWFLALLWWWISRSSEHSNSLRYSLSVWGHNLSEKYPCTCDAAVKSRVRVIYGHFSAEMPDFLIPCDCLSSCPFILVSLTFCQANFFLFFLFFFF